ncbi:tyrosine-type recombinase/integrase (plasmid) [Clostridium beijerinckii]|uniref:tyrosine-type recombinase/integrase n=1 Tax=Clostridium beijerinckii TaxID=1520 RepID=UPI002227C765|nr:tyrosine-type recombinase/integrase [Clostridium beijerinckii]UYZ39057.1 tyrosine-type recombinase/integrase [Clostridium beijerinckii]
MIIDNLEAFETSLMEDERSSKTIEAYQSDIIQFFDFLEENNIKEIHNDVLKKYKNYLLFEKTVPNSDKKGLSPSSVNRKLISIHRYLEFNEISAKVNPVKMQRQNFLENVVSKSEIDGIVEEAKAQSDYKAIAIIRTLELTGMRVSELLQLTIHDIYLNEVKIVGKGNKSRLVLIPGTLNEIWIDYYKKERIFMKKAKEFDSLFIGQRGPTSRNGIDIIIKKYGELAGVNFEKNHAHGYRHGFCKTLDDNGIPINDIADLAGHSTIETTRIYTRKSKEELRNVINRINK